LRCPPGPVGGRPVAALAPSRMDDHAGLALDGRDRRRRSGCAAHHRRAVAPSPAGDPARCGRGSYRPERVRPGRAQEAAVHPPQATWIWAGGAVIILGVLLGNVGDRGVIAELATRRIPVTLPA